MSLWSDRGGRQNQKERTRRAIVAAAAKLIAAGTLPTMPEVADEALVSTATAYRYFPDQLSLLSAALQDGYAGIGERFEPDIGPERDLERRVDIATEGLLRRIVDREPLVRTVMALSLLRSVDGATPREDAIKRASGLPPCVDRRGAPPRARTSSTLRSCDSSSSRSAR